LDVHYDDDGGWRHLHVNLVGRDTSLVREDILDGKFTVFVVILDGTGSNKFDLDDWDHNHHLASGKR
jgi:hypothetical protein